MSRNGESLRNRVSMLLEHTKWQHLNHMVIISDGLPMEQLSEDTREEQQKFPKNPPPETLKTGANEDLPIVF